MFSRQEITNPTELKAIEIFDSAYASQMEGDYDAAINLYKESIKIFPTAEAFTFLGWAYSFKGEYDLAIAECLAAISVDATFGNPYNDIGSYLIAKGNFYDCERWFKLAMKAPRYEARAFPLFNLATVYERHGKFLLAAKYYGLAIKEQPNYAQAYNALRRLQSKLN